MFFLVDYKPNLKEVFELDKEIDTFKTLKELRRKVAYYIYNSEKRRKIAKAMFERVKKDHTYEVWFKKLYIKIHSSLFHSQRHADLHL